jgi:MarR family transcriptional regulator, 2-MHQ and catechol-resistance regulon repressor
VATISGVHLWLILMKAYHSLAARSAAHFRKFGLGDSDFRVLEVLLHKGPLPVNVIGPKVFLTPGSISVAVSRLCERGLVTRRDSDQDRRMRVVALTAKGRALISKAFEAHVHDMEDIAQVLPPEMRAHLADALKRLGKRAAGSEENQAG